MADLTMQDGTSQCRHGSCNGLCWEYLWIYDGDFSSGGVSISNTILLIVSTILVTILTYRLFQKKSLIFTQDNASSPDLLRAYKKLMCAVCGWVYLSIIWFVGAYLYQYDDYDDETVVLPLMIITYSVLQFFKIFIYVGSFIYLSHDSTGTPVMKSSFFISAIWGSIYASFEWIYWANPSIFWEVFPFIRLLSYALQTALCLYLIIKRQINDFTVLKHRRTDVLLPERVKALSSVDPDPLLTTLKSRRPLHPFGYLALAYSTFGFSTSLLIIIGDKNIYGCTLAMECMSFYILLPISLYKALLEDSALSQNLFSRLDAADNIPEYKMVDFVNSEKALGGGACGRVFLGTLQGREVCIKKFSGTPDKETNTYHLVREVTILGRLSHDYIVKLYGIAFGEEGECYAFLEYCRGGDLRSYIEDKNSELGYYTVLKFLLQIASALNHLHKNELLHGDLKTRNILLDEKRDIRLCDFDKAKFTTTREPNEDKDKVEGTLEYLSPELLSQKPSIWKSSFMQFILPCDTEEPISKERFAADVYAFGIIIFELLTRKEPPTTNSKETKNKDKKQAVVCSTPITVKTMSDGVLIPDELSNLLQRCLEIDPSKRPSMQDVCAQLEKCKP